MDVSDSVCNGTSCYHRNWFSFPVSVSVCWWVWVTDCAMACVYWTTWPITDLMAGLVSALHGQNLHIRLSLWHFWPAYYNPQQGTIWSGMTRAAQNRVRWRGVVHGLCSTESDGRESGSITNLPFFDGIEPEPLVSSHPLILWLFASVYTDLNFVLKIFWKKQY